MAGSSLVSRLEATARSGDVATDYAEIGESIDDLERTARRLRSTVLNWEEDGSRDLDHVRHTDPALAMAVRNTTRWREEQSAQTSEAIRQSALRARAFRSTLGRSIAPTQTSNDGGDLMRRLDEALAE